jgi:hypothetical protein
MQILRRQSLKGIGLMLAAAAGYAHSANAMQVSSLIPAGAHSLDMLKGELEKAPRRRDFTSVPMILDNRDQWDAEALDAVLAYAGGPRQSWDNTDLTGPWLNVMRNAMNVEIWGFKHPDFLCVSATHGSAQLVLYDEFIWEKYNLAKLAGSNVTRDHLVLASSASDQNPLMFEAPDGPFSGATNNIVGLQRRGAVFLACHNAVWEHADILIAANLNPDHLTTDKLCAEMTNHLIPGVILTPGAVGTLVELHTAGFAYAR